MPARAVVKVELSIDVPDNWGDDCTVGQVRKQAIDSAKRDLEKAFTCVQGVRVMSIEATVVTVPPRS